MAELKTKPNAASVTAFLAGLADAEQRKDCRALIALMRRVTKEKPVMWGPSIVGFGTYHYVYESGRSGDWFVTGFSPRKPNLTLYLMSGLHQHANLLARLGKHKTGGSCLYIRRLADVDPGVLEKLVRESVKRVRKSART